MTPSDSPTRTYDPERTVTANDSPEHAATTPRFDAPFDDALTVPGYELLAELGRGGMGVVYKARHVGLNRLVALKMILSGAHAGDRDRVRFLAEAEAVAAIRHPNVLQVYDFGNHAGRPYMALEYCEGGALTAWLKDRGPLPPREAAELLEQIARGVGAAHELGIVHRDLKPGNILLSKSSSHQVGTSSGQRPNSGPDNLQLDDLMTCKVADFGLAKKTSSEHLTGTGAVMGTPAYMAPEQAKGDTKFVGPAADVYALGAILFECLTGRPPFLGNMAEVLRQVADEEPPPVRTLAPGTPRDLALICEKCLAKAPHERYGTANELAEELRRYTSGEPVSVRSVGAVEKAAKWARRKPTLAAAYLLGTGVAGLSLVVLVVGALLILAIEQREIADQAAGRAQVAQDEAVKARDQLAIEKGLTERALNETEIARAGELQAKRNVDRLNYLHSINLAADLVQSNTLTAANEFLRDCPPEYRHWEWRYLDRLCHPELAVIPTPHEYISAAVFDRSGTRVFTVGLDAQLNVLDVATRKVVATRSTDSRELLDVALSPNGERLFTNSPGVLRVWSTDELRELHAIRYPQNQYHFAWFTPDSEHIAKAAMTGEITFHKVSNGEVVKTLRHPSDETVLAAAFPKGRMRILTADPKRVLRLRDLESNSPPLEIAGVQMPLPSRGIRFGIQPYTVDLSPDGERIVFSGFGSIYPSVWEAKTNKLRTLSTNQGAVRFTPDGTGVLLAQREVKILDVATGEERASYPGARDTLRMSAMSPDGQRLLAYGGQRQPLRVWQAIRQSRPMVVSRTANFILPAAVLDRRGSRLWIDEPDGTIREFDTSTGQETRTIDKLPRKPNSLTMSPDGTLAAAFLAASQQSATEGMVRVYDTATGRTLQELRKDQAAVVRGYSPDGKSILTVHKDGPRWTSIATGEQRGAFPESSDVIAQSADSLQFLTQEREGPPKIRSFDGSIVSQLSEFPEVKSPDSIWLIGAFSPDGQWVAIACQDLNVRVWDAKTGRLVSRLKDYSPTAILGMAFHPDGSRLVTTTTMYSNLWDVATGRRVLQFLALPRPGVFNHGGGTTAGFTADGNSLILAGNSRTTMIRFDAEAK